MSEGGADPLITRNIIARNSAPGGGGMEFWTSAGGTVANNLFVGNTANYGPQVFLSDGGNPDLVNNTFVGGSVEIWWGTPQIINNIFSNCALALPNGIPPGAGIGNNCFQGTNGVLVGQNGNIAANPLFVNPSSESYPIGPDSSCANAGDSSAAAGPLDLAGRPRVIGSAVDIGAYESLLLVTLADAKRALRIAAGIEASPADIAALDLHAGGGITLEDALALLRIATGASPIPWREVITSTETQGRREPD